jgi:lipopolysaccharide transport system ATP-binding protein
MPPVVSCEDLGKRYRVNHAAPRVSTYRTFRDDLVGLLTAPLRRLRRGAAAGTVEDFWALQKVNFEIEPGEVVGVIGRNGAGKSTLLKILARITKPTTGLVKLRGRVGSLLEVGTGFHPELTGRENISLNGAILGMARAEIARKFDQIVDFAEVEQFLDTPVKRYSSGMYVRLAFAVAAHLESEILLVDEVLAVGDLSFQRKCLGKMQSLSEGGRTVLFVSHNMPAVRSLTHRCLYLRGGQVVGDGPTATVIDRYLEDSWRQRDAGAEHSLDYYRRDRVRDRSVTIERLWITGGDGGDPPVLNSGDDFTVHCQFVADREYPCSYSGWWLTNQQGERVVTFFNPDSGFPMAIRKGVQTVACRVKGLPLSPGRYTLSLGINQGVSTVAFDVILDLPAFHVVMPEVENGRLEWPQRPWGCVHWTDTVWCHED